MTEIRQLSRADVPLLFDVISRLPPHGHRSWRVSDADQLDALLDESRISPEHGAWSIAFDGSTPCGYSLTEPELNINRIVIGCAVTAGNESFYPVVLSDAIVRAEDMASEGQIQIQIAIQETEPDYVREHVSGEGFVPVREFWKMRADAAGLASEDVGLSQGLVVRRLRFDEPAEIAAVTRLHNLCFRDSWGFSPNSDDEIEDRVNVDYERTDVPPMLIAVRDDEPEPVAYVWTTMHESDGRIEMIGVAPEVRGTGLGRRLFNIGAQHLIEHGAETISLEVDSQNEPAINMYQSVGLETYSRTTYYGHAA